MDGISFRTSKNAAGLGFGLLISNNIAEILNNKKKSHGGGI